VKPTENNEITEQECAARKEAPENQQMDKE